MSPEEKRLARNARSREKRAENPEHYRQIEARKRERIRQDRPDEYRRQYMSSNLKKTHGITLEQKRSMLSAQGGKCAICGTTEPGGRGDFHVDHSHENGKIRGVLCHRCNIGIGSLREDVAILFSAIDYLMNHSGRPLLEAC